MTIPLFFNSEARTLTLLQVHRKGDSGSSRVTCSSRDSNSVLIFGYFFSIGLRPLPFFLTAWDVDWRALLFAFNSLHPSVIALRDTAVARATAVIPP